MGPTRTKVGDFFLWMRWLRMAVQETDPSFSIQMQTNGQAHTWKGVHRKPNKGWNLCFKTRQGCKHLPQNIAQGYIL